MMFKLSEREKRISGRGNMKKEVDLSNELSNVSCLSPVHHHHHHHNHQQRLPLFSLSRVSMQSSSPSSPSSFSNGFCSSEDGGSLIGLCLDSKPPPDFHNSSERFLDELGLSHNLYRMNIRDEQNVGSTKMEGLEFGSNRGSCGSGGLQYNVNKYSYYGGGGPDIGGFKSCSPGVSLVSDDDTKISFSAWQGEYEKGYCQPTGNLGSASSWYNTESEFLFQDTSNTRHYLNDAVFEQFTVDSNGGRSATFPFSSHMLMHSKLDLSASDPLYRSPMLIPKTTKTIANNVVSDSLMCLKGAAGVSCEDSFIIQDKSSNYVPSKGVDPFRRNGKDFFNDISAQNRQGKNIKLDSCNIQGGICENGQNLSRFTQIPVVPNINSLGEIQGQIYFMSQDQNGCRFIQRILEEGTSRDVEIIFNEIIDHIVELMLKSFGNYVVQKFLDVCSEEQRLQIVLMVTKLPGLLVKICLNTYGTRVVQKLIETLKTRQQISLIVFSLKPGFLDLMKDQNGNHVIQRCLQCLSNEDNKFVFESAAKFCVEIATHRHGCCVMQRCISRPTGRHRDKLVTEISENGLLLAQDPFGNYVVQYLIELKSPSTVANLLAQFKGHYIHLSTQKFSSHVVEKCLKLYEECRSQVVSELLSVPHFEQLLQDQFANYVIQTALSVTKGPLHSLLVEAVRPHTSLRTSPYCKRIFSRNLLKKS